MGGSEVALLALVALAVALLIARTGTREPGTRTPLAPPTPRATRRPRATRPPLVRLSPISLTFPNDDELPAEVLTVPSTLTPGRVYELDLGRITCTCDYWRESHGRFDVPDVRRLCRHLADVLDDRSMLEGASEVVRAYLSDIHPPKDGLYAATLSGGQLVVIGASLGDEWFDVYARTQRDGERVRDASGPYRRYGFSIVPHKGWSFGDAPPHAREIRDLIAELRA